MQDLLRSIIALLIEHIPNRKFRDLLLWPLSKRLFANGYKKIIKIEDGLNMYVYGDMADMVNKTLLFRAQYTDLAWEPATSRFLKSLLSKYKVAVVAGSHIGYYPLILSRFLQTVYAFEPNPLNYKRLDENLLLNNCKNVIKEKSALGDKIEDKLMYFDFGQSSLVNKDSDCKESGIVSVNTLDNFFLNKDVLPDLMIFDAEGYEPKILKGSEKIIDKVHPDIIFEINPGALSAVDSSSEDLCNFLINKGYKIYFIEDDYNHSFDKKYSLLPKIVPCSMQKIDSHKFINAFATVSDI